MRGVRIKVTTQNFEEECFAALVSSSEMRSEESDSDFAVVLALADGKFPVKL